MTELKPTAFKRGVPAEQANGLYGIEEYTELQAVTWPT